MKFSVTVGELARALGLIGGVVSVKTTIPILTHVLIKTSEGRVSLTATDLERECTAEAPAEIVDPGTDVFHGAVLKSIVSSLPKAATLTISRVPGEGRALLVCSRARYRVGTLEAEDFPTAKVADGISFKIDAKKFRALLESTIGSASSESTRYYLCGVYLHIAHGALVAVSTDGHRLCKRSMDVPAGATELPGAIIPSASVTTLMALLEGIEGDVTMWVTKSRLWLRTPHAEFSTSLINGNYPDYGRVIPQFNGSAATLPSADFCAAVERAANALPDTKIVVAGLRIGDDGLFVEVGPRGEEAAIEHIEAECHQTGADIGFNSKYLAAMTKVWGGAPIDMHVGGAGDPAVFTSKAIPEQLYVIMPMRR